MKYSLNNKLYLFSFVITIYICSIIPFPLGTNTAMAQEASLQRPEIEVSDILLDKDKYKNNEIINGSFNIKNERNYGTGNIFYAISLTTGDDEKGRFNNAFYFTKSELPLYLEANAEQSINFAFTIPEHLPKDKLYGLRIDVFLKNGILLGFDKKTLDINTSTDSNKLPSITISNEVIKIDNDLVSLTQQPIIYENERLNIEYQLTNNSDEEIVVTPKISISRSYDGKSDVFSYENAKVSVKAKGMVNISNTIRTDIYEAGVYVMKIELFNKDDIQMSSPIIFSYVLDGNIVSIDSIISDKGSRISRGEEMDVTIHYRGKTIDIRDIEKSTDIKNAQVKVILKNKKEKIIAEGSQKIDLLNQGVITIPVKSTRSANGFTIEVEIMDEDRSLLGKDVLDVPSLKLSLVSRIVNFDKELLGLVAILFILFLIFKIKKKVKINKLLILLFFITITFLNTDHSVYAYTIVGQVGNTEAIPLNITVELDKGKYKFTRDTATEYDWTSTKYTSDNRFKDQPTSYPGGTKGWRPGWNGNNAEPFEVTISVDAPEISGWHQDLNVYTSWDGYSKGGSFPFYGERLGTEYHWNWPAYVMSDGRPYNHMHVPFGLPNKRNWLGYDPNYYEWWANLRFFGGAKQNPDPSLLYDQRFEKSTYCGPLGCKKEFVRKFRGTSIIKKDSIGEGGTARLWLYIRNNLTPQQFLKTYGINEFCYQGGITHQQPYYRTCSGYETTKHIGTPYGTPGPGKSSGTLIYIDIPYYDSRDPEKASCVATIDNQNAVSSTTPETQISWILKPEEPNSFSNGTCPDTDSCINGVPVKDSYLRWSGDIGESPKGNGNTKFPSNPPANSDFTLWGDVMSTYYATSTDNDKTVTAKLEYFDSRTNGNWADDNKWQSLSCQVLIVGNDICPNVTGLQVEVPPGFSVSPDISQAESGQIPYSDLYCFPTELAIKGSVTLSANPNPIVENKSTVWSYDISDDYYEGVYEGNTYTIPRNPTITWSGDITDDAYTENEPGSKNDTNFNNTVTYSKAGSAQVSIRVEDEYVTLENISFLTINPDEPICPGQPMCPFGSFESAPIISSFNINPNVINESEKCKLSWSVENVISCTLKNQESTISVETSSQGYDVEVGQYILTCQNDADELSVVTSVPRSCILSPDLKED